MTGSSAVDVAEGERVALFLYLFVGAISIFNPFTQTHFVGECTTMYCSHPPNREELHPPGFQKTKSTTANHRIYTAGHSLVTNFCPGRILV